MQNYESNSKRYIYKTLLPSSQRTLLKREQKILRDKILGSLLEDYVSWWCQKLQP